MPRTIQNTKKFFYIKHSLVFSCFILCLSGCHFNDKKYEAPLNALFTPLSSNETGINFNNELVASENFNVFTYRNFYNGGGVSIGDINNDGLADIYFTSNMGENKLYLNKGNFKFEDITAKANVEGNGTWNTGVTIADVNGDGLLDIYVCRASFASNFKRGNELFINQGNLTFKEEAAQYGLNDSAVAIDAVFFDYDCDGDLDMFELNNSPRPVASFGYSKNLRDARSPIGGGKLFRNDNGHFIDVSEEAGIYGSEIGFGEGVSVADLNGDNWPDIYVSNDFFEKDYLYINQHDGTFKESIDECAGHLSMASMGADIGDINNDALPDIFVPEMLPEGDKRMKQITKFEDYNTLQTKVRSGYNYQFIQNAFQLNNGNNTFSEISFLSNTGATDWSWGALMFDFENDGWKDIFISNGVYKDATDQDFISYMSSEKIRRSMIEGKVDYLKLLDSMPSVPVANYAYLNQRNLTFLNKARDLGLAEPGFSNGAAYGDLDNDGDLDLVVNNINMKSFVYRNEANKKFNNHYLKIKLDGEGLNRFGIGANVTAFCNGQTYSYYQMLTRGFESSVDPIINMGLGTHKIVDSIIVAWPNQKMQVFKKVQTQSTLICKESEANIPFRSAVSLKGQFADVSTNIIQGNSLHKENGFIDFDNYTTLPQIFSTEGPKCIKGDVNNDGLEDIYVCGAKDDTGKLFIQTPGGKLTRSNQSAFIQNDADETGAVFIDVNGDHKPDLIVVKGGNEDTSGSTHLIPLVYINKGKGIFSKAVYLNDKVSVNASCIKVADINGDGLPDLFIGGRIETGKYPLSPRSFLLINDGKGRFKDETQKLAPQLQFAGLVTDACFTDVNNDGKADLIIVGDWMPVTIFKNTGNNSFTRETIAGSEGWWNSINAKDINGDGNVDFVLGNLGLNSKLKADQSHPLTLYTNDFGDNGFKENILCYYKNDSICYPLTTRWDMIKEIPSLKKRFLYYKDYGGKTISEIFDSAQLQNAIVRKAYQLQSCIALNDGKGNFKLNPLPVQAQFSPMYASLVEDLNKDGKIDILSGGNFYGVKPEIGRYDASYSTFLKGDGKGNFSYVPNSETGMNVKGQVRDIVKMHTVNGGLILFIKNNERIQVYKEDKSGVSTLRK